MVLQNVHVIKQKQMLRLIHTHLQTHTVVKIFSGSLSQLMHSSGQGWSDRLGVIDWQFVCICVMCSFVAICIYLFVSVCPLVCIRAYVVNKPSQMQDISARGHPMICPIFTGRYPWHLPKRLLCREKVTGLGGWL